jgi:hypothetical protein
MINLRSSGYFMYHKFKKGVREGKLHSRTDSEGPEEEWGYSSAHSFTPELDEGGE